MFNFSLSSSGSSTDVCIYIRYVLSYLVDYFDDLGVFYGSCFLNIAFTSSVTFYRIFFSRTIFGTSVSRYNYTSPSDINYVIFSTTGNKRINSNYFTFNPVYFGTSASLFARKSPRRTWESPFNATSHATLSASLIGKSTKSSNSLSNYFSYKNSGSACKSS